ncbi:hypothetical protein SELMODRAFT_413445 [Selaginella moellendorffii]|uniref:Cyclic nucleotide-binding domain-containing protein n=1 Tax=Selaginella moellendorffii TaxID=88036 RepID=D8RPH4_SELML|nr:hypothetical protein SELMODRAFT_413445 [Selaginella moellendorffii]
MAILFTIGDKDVSVEQAMEFLGSVPLLQQLPAGLIKKIAHALKPMRFAPGETLVREGEAGEGFYIVWKGEAEVAGVSNTLILKPGDYFGSGEFAPGVCPEHLQEIHKADVVAVDEVICLVLTHEHHALVSSDSIWTDNQRKDVATVERVLELDKLDVDLYRGLTAYPSETGRVFGGQLIGQALAAACKSVDPSLLVHSLHSNFLVAGDEALPIMYQVERVRDGHRFATRCVRAMQRGQEIFRLTASFQRLEKSLEHQRDMPEAPRPEDVLPREVLEQRYRVDARIPLRIKKKLAAAPHLQYPMEVRLCDPVDLVNPTQLEPRQRVWLKARQKLSDDQSLHCCVAAYASDSQFIGTALRPLRTSSGQRFRILSLDHSMWFHQPFRADEWLLFVMESPFAGNGRGFATGHMYTQSGELVISVAQEGVFGPYKRSKL